MLEEIRLNFLKNFGYPPRDGIVPIYFLPNNRLDHFTYFILQFYRNVSLIGYDTHPDEIISMHMGVSTELTEKLQKMYPKVLEIKETEKRLRVRYQKNNNVTMGPDNYMEDVLESGRVLKSYWISKWCLKDEGVKACMFRKTVRKEGDAFVFRETAYDTSDSVVELTKKALAGCKKVYVHYDPDIHPKSVIDAGFWHGKAPVKEMKESLEAILFSEKMVGMSVFTNKHPITAMVEEIASKFK
jgi:hypothetical protein